jgi:hypothetical protein
MRLANSVRAVELVDLERHVEPWKKPRIDSALEIGRDRQGTLGAERQPCER